VAVDLVAVSDSDLAKQISKLTAAQWFENKNDYKLSDSKPGVLTVCSWELGSGQKRAPQIEVPAPKPLKLPVKIPIVAAPATSVFVFANYSSPGPHRATLQPNKMTTVLLAQDDLKIVVDKTVVNKLGVEKLNSCEQ
jgi:type VI secretion system protein